MKTDQQKINELGAYLKEAKAKQWTIDISDLMQRFGLAQDQVRAMIAVIYK